MDAQEIELVTRLDATVGIKAVSEKAVNKQQLIESLFLAVWRVMSMPSSAPSQHPQR
jgi:hypothetical protein